MKSAIVAKVTAQAKHWSNAKLLLIAVPAVLLVAVHVLLIVWGSVKLGDRIGGWSVWMAVGALVAFGLYHAIAPLRGKGHGLSHAHGAHSGEGGEIERGSHGGVVVNLGHGFAEITVSKADAPPRFQVFLYDRHRQELSVCAPRVARAVITIETMRHNGVRQTFAFRAKNGCLESIEGIPEPHEFTLVFRLSHGKHTHRREIRFQK